MTATTARRSSAPGAPRTRLALARALLSNASPLVLILIVSSAWIGRVALGGWSWWDLLAGTIVLALWPPLEWLIHRFLLHSRPRRIGPFVLDALNAKMHRAHHLQPWNFDHVFVPIHTYLYAAPIFGLAFWFGTALHPSFGTGVALFATLGLHYEWCHSMAHSNYVPKSAIYKRIWKNHRLHHFKNEHYWLGVSNLIGDQIFGTKPEHSDVQSSPTCLTLGIRELE